MYGLLVIGLPVLGLSQAVFTSFGLAGPLAQGFTTQHWQQLGTGGGLLTSLAYSVYVALASLGLSVGVALWLVVSRQQTLSRSPFPTLLYIPLLFPSLVMGFYLFQLLSRSGWLSRITYQLGLTSRIEAFPELVQDPAGIGIILAHVLMAFPFLTLLFQTLYTDTRLAELRNLTLTLGASEGQFRRKIAVPVLLRRAAPTLVLYGVAVLGAYDIPLLLGRTYPQMVSLFVTDRLSRFDLAEIPVGYAAGLVVAVLLMSIIGYMAEPPETMRSKMTSSISANRQPGRNLGLVIGMCLLVALPFVLLLILSVGQVWRFPDVLPPEYSFDAFARILSVDSELLSGSVLSVTLSATVAVVTTGLGFLISRAVARSRWAEWWVTLSYLPYALPPVLLAVVIQPSIIRLRLSGSVGGVLLGMLLITLPFTTLFFRSFWSRQATQYEQLAQTLGCTPAQGLTRVLLPLARPLLVTCLFQTFLIGWFDFGLTNFLSVGKVRTLTVQVFMYVREANSRLAAVASLLLILLPALLFWFNKSAIAPRTVVTNGKE